MICNSKLTIYHQDGLDVSTHLEKWKKYNYNNVWFFGKESSTANKGYNDSNTFECRIPYDSNADLDASNFAIGDIVVEGELTQEISTQQDLSDYLVYNITSISNNDFGNNQHIHISGQ